jgi:SAM-dependent methyltransferase
MSEHYNRIDSWQQIRARIQDATPDGLAPIDQLHTGGLIASRLLAKFARIRKGEKVLDVGCGAGGGSRVIAGEVGADVTGIDLSGGLIDLAQRLGALSGIYVDFRQADALALPFEDESFDVVWTQHCATNIADKPRLYAEMRRVLKPGGRMAMHDLMQGPNPGPLHMPVPFADSEDESFLAETESLKALLARSGFREMLWRDRTEATLAFFETLRDPEPEPFSIRLVLGRQFPEMVRNLRLNLHEGRVGAAMGLFAAV